MTRTLVSPASYVALGRKIQALRQAVDAVTKRRNDARAEYNRLENEADTARAVLSDALNEFAEVEIEPEEPPAMSELWCQHRDPGFGSTTCLQARPCPKHDAPGSRS